MAIDSMEHEGSAADMNHIPNAGWRLAGGNWVGPVIFLLVVAQILAMFRR